MGIRQTTFQPGYYAPASSLLRCLGIAAVGCVLAANAPLLTDTLAHAGSLLLAGLAYTAWFIVRAAVVLAALSLVAVLVFHMRTSRWGRPIDVSAAPGFVSRWPIFSLKPSRSAAPWRATGADWSLMVHLSSLLWILIGLGMSGLLQVLGVTI